jgi:hypothetical protein
MATITTTNLGTPRFVADEHSITRSNGGRQVDWANVPASAPYLQADGVRKLIRAGTAVGELLGSGKISPRVVTTNPATLILETDAYEGDLSAAASGYGCIDGGNLYENLLPDSTGGPPRALASALKTELTAAGCRFKFYTYQDDR